MIVVLCGEGPLKTGLTQHLLEKSFYLRGGQEFDGLEPDKNYVVDAPASLAGLQPWRERTIAHRVDWPQRTDSCKRRASHCRRHV